MSPFAKGWSKATSSTRTRPGDYQDDGAGQVQKCCCEKYLGNIPKSGPGHTRIHGNHQNIVIARCFYSCLDFHVFLYYSMVFPLSKAVVVQTLLQTLQ